MVLDRPIFESQPPFIHPRHAMRLNHLYALCKAHQYKTLGITAKEITMLVARTARHWFIDPQTDVSAFARRSEGADTSSSPIICQRLFQFAGSATSLAKYLFSIRVRVSIDTTDTEFMFVLKQAFLSMALIGHNAPPELQARFVVFFFFPYSSLMSAAAQVTKSGLISQRAQIGILNTIDSFYAYAPVLDLRPKRSTMRAGKAQALLNISVLTFLLSSRELHKPLSEKANTALFLSIGSQISARFPDTSSLVARCVSRLLQRSEHKPLIAANTPAVDHVPVIIQGISGTVWAHCTSPSRAEPVLLTSLAALTLLVTSAEMTFRIFASAFCLLSNCISLAIKQCPKYKLLFYTAAVNRAVLRTTFHLCKKLADMPRCGLNDPTTSSLRGRLLVSLCLTVDNVNSSAFRVEKDVEKSKARIRQPPSWSRYVVQAIPRFMRYQWQETDEGRKNNLSLLCRIPTKAAMFTVESFLWHFMSKDGAKDDSISWWSILYCRFAETWTIRLSRRSSSANWSSYAPFHDRSQRLIQVGDFLKNQLRLVDGFRNQALRSRVHGAIQRFRCDFREHD